MKVQNILICAVLIGLGFLIFLNIWRTDIYRISELQTDMGGDGFKNYFTFSYQYLYGGLFDFKGMLYPYSDIGLYADAQLSIIWILKFLGIFGFDLSKHLLLVLNLLPFFSIVMGCAFIYLILRQHSVEKKLALICCFACIALSPQMLRIQSHFALSYVCIIPMFIYGLLRFKQTSRTLLIFMMLVGFMVFIGFIHPYYIFIVSILALSIFAYEVLLKKLNLRLLALGTVPIAIFYGILTLVDPHSDRPSNPFGLNIYKTDFSDLIPYYGWGKFLFHDTAKFKAYYSEGFAYVSVAIIGAIVYFLIKNKISNNLRTASPGVFTIYSFLFSGIFVLLFSMGILNLISGNLISDLISPLKQFRSLGRVSWAYYYLFFISGSVALNWIYTSLTQATQKYLFLVVLITVFMIDVLPFHQSIRENMEIYKSEDILKNNTVIHKLLKIKGYNPEQFQSVYTLPSSTEGMEKLSLKDDWFTKLNSFAFAKQTGIPLMSCVQSRAPISPVLNIVGLSSSSFAEKKILDDFPSDKPLLVVLQNDRISEFKEVLDQCTFIGKEEQISLYSLDIVNVINEKVTTIDSLHKSTQLSSEISSGSPIVFYNDFDNSHEHPGLKDHGSYFLNDGVASLLSESLNLKDSIQMQMSIWYKITPDESNVPVFTIETKGSDRSLRLLRTFRDWDFQRIEVIDDWVRLKVEFTLNSLDSSIECKIQGHHILLDKLLITPSQSSFYQIENNGYIWKDHLIQKSE